MRKTPSGGGGAGGLSSAGGSYGELASEERGGLWRANGICSAMLFIKYTKLCSNSLRSKTY